MTNNLPARTADIERYTETRNGSWTANAKKQLDAAARKIGREAVNHLKQMYPDALAAVTTNAERSLTNFIRNRINTATFALLAHAETIRVEREEFRQEIGRLQEAVAERDQEIERLRAVVAR